MKTTFARRFFGAAVIAAAFLFAFAPKGRADLTYVVTLNVASLIGNANGPFSLDVALSNGATFPDADNTVKLSNFSVTGGSLGAVSFSSGGETGSMSSTVTLTNSSEDNELAQLISANVTQISFSVDETSVTDNPEEDQFDVAIFDNNSNNIPTTDPSGANTLVLSNINTAQTLSSVGTYNSTAGGEAPGVTTAAAVPEPGSIASVLLGLAAAGLFTRKAFRRSAAA